MLMLEKAGSESEKRFVIKTENGQVLDRKA